MASPAAIPRAHRVVDQGEIPVAPGTDNVVTEVDLRIDRSSPVPLYYQFAEQLEAAIRAGRLAHGQRLENELDLAQRYGLSRPTVRQAIQELVRKGLLVRKRGVGTQVVHGPAFTRPVALSSLFDDLARTGLRPRSDLRSFETRAADGEVSEALRVPEGAPVVRIERLRWAAGEPLALMVNWLPAALAAFEQDRLEAHGLYELLRRTGVHMRIATQRIGARPATAAEARLLGERRGAALLTMERVAYDDQGRPVEYGSHVYRAGTYRFEVTLVDR
jgi:DNA-binding GntR family transcriptional regulator